MRARAAEHLPPPPPPISYEPRDAVATSGDAAPGAAANVFRAAAHAVVLLSVVVFVVAYCVVIPVRRQLAGGRESATVMVVADPLLTVRSPDVTGLFVATRPLPHGARVRKGELLGRIHAPKLDDELAMASTESANLQVRLLRLEQRNAIHGATPQEALEARELSARLDAVQQAVGRLRTLKSHTAVYAPSDGWVQQGLAASVAVVPRDAIVSLYPDGGSLVLEVSAPLEVLRQVQRNGRVAAIFATPEGKAKVLARPVSTSVRQSIRTLAGGREEAWGTVRCVPESMPIELRSPGLIGQLES